MALQLLCLFTVAGSVVPSIDKEFFPSQDGHEAEDCSVTDFIDGGVCISTVTATSTVGVSLVQAFSGRTRHSGLKEESEREQDGLRRMVAATSLLLQKGETLIRSAFQNVLQYATSSLPVHTSRYSVGAVVITLLFLTIFAVLLVCVLRVGGKTPRSSESPFTPELSMRPHADSLARSSFRPVGASPAMSVRSAKASPGLSQQRLPNPEASQLVAGRPRELARGVGISSEEEERPRTSGGISIQGPQFCPDLIVPQHCECILVLPLDLGRARTSFAITDVNGSPVLRAVPQQQSMGRSWRATITTATGETLVHCCERRSKTANEGWGEYELFRSGGELFAKMTHSPSQDRYLLTMQTGTVLHFWGNFENSAVNITDDDNRLLATTEIGSADYEPNGTFCRLRVAPLADVGLALCGLMCIGQHMVNSQHSHRRTM